jgi:hypothetical protein
VDRKFAEPQVSQEWNKLVPVWHGLVSEWNAEASPPERQAFAAYIADDQRRAVERAFAAVVEQAAQERPIAAAEIEGHRMAEQLAIPHRDAVTHMIEAPPPPPGETTLSMEAVPGEPDTFETP